MLLSYDVFTTSGQKLLIASQQKNCNLRNLLLSYDDVDNPRPETANAQFSGWKTWVSSNFTWLYIGSQVSQKKSFYSIILYISTNVFDLQDAWMLFLIYLAFSKFSQVKLGADDSVPEFNNITW